MNRDPAQLRSFIDQWRHAIIHESPDVDRLGRNPSGGYNPNKRKRAETSRRPIMTTPPASSSSDRTISPKRRKLPDRSVPGQQQDEDDVFADPDPEQTPRRSITSYAPKLPCIQATGTGQAGQSDASVEYALTPSIASSRTSTKSRARSISPTKKTQNLVALRKPIHHVAIEDNATDQLPHDVRALYNRLYDITVDHEAFLPWEAREDICRAVGRRVKNSWFRTAPGTTDGRTEEEEERSAALAELNALRNLERAAWECRQFGRSEAAWNLEVHGPLLELGLARHAHVRRELVTTAQIAKSFLPPMDAYSVAEYVDKKMVDFVLVLDPDGARHDSRALSGGGDEALAAAAQDRAEYGRLARAIQQEVYSQPQGCQSINQTAYTPLLCRPIGVSIETKADGASEEGRIQLAIWAAAWHQRMSSLLEKRCGPSCTGTEGDELGSDALHRRVVTLPVLLIVDHAWVLSFVCDRGDRLEIVGDITLGDTRTLLGLYTLVAVVRELGHWIEGPFRLWISDLLS